MSESKETPPLTRKAILDRMKTPPPGGYFVWNGLDEDERPVTPEDFDAARAAQRAKRGQQTRE